MRTVWQGRISESCPYRLEMQAGEVQALRAPGEIEHLDANDHPRQQREHMDDEQMNLLLPEIANLWFRFLCGLKLGELFESSRANLDKRSYYGMSLPHADHDASHIVCLG
ncbi:MAG: hypothetical protein WCH98_15035 [Verrucomicrobiota bacterium]